MLTDGFTDLREDKPELWNVTPGDAKTFHGPTEIRVPVGRVMVTLPDETPVELGGQKKLLETDASEALIVALETGTVVVS